MKISYIRTKSAARFSKELKSLKQKRVGWCMSANWKGGYIYMYCDDCKKGFKNRYWNYLPFNHKFTRIP